jgi:acyl-CoA thioesterase
MSTPDRYSREGILAFAKTFPFFRLIGLEVVDVGPGWSKARLPYREDLTQPAGIIHGGMITTLIDTGIAHALMISDRATDLGPQDGALVSVDVRVKFLRPVSQGSVHCDAKVVRRGRHILHAEAIATDDDGKEVARGDAIYMAVPRTQVTQNT